VATAAQTAPGIAPRVAPHIEQDQIRLRSILGQTVAALKTNDRKPMTSSHEPLTKTRHNTARVFALAVQER
jgi:hypothetical protein